MQAIDLQKLDKRSAISFISEIHESDLWDIFLNGQAQLLASCDIDHLEKIPSFDQAESILEIGSGNGAFLHKVHKKHPSKQYHGIDYNEGYVKTASSRYANASIQFKVKDAEKLHLELKSSFNIIIFRFTLQHLQNPKLALKHAYQYLRPKGCICIIDAEDSSNGHSHPLTILEKALLQAKSLQEKDKTKGNRDFTAKLEEDLNNPKSDLQSFFDQLHNSISTETIPGSKISTHLLLFSGLVNKRYGISLDFDKHYDEVQTLSSAPGSWFKFGIQRITLQKKAKC